MKNLREALDGMRACLTLLDADEAPAEIGAHLDLAICRLEEHLTKRAPEGPTEA
jgi:hypothetical protein